MMGDMNVLVLEGRLANDPDLSYKGDLAYATFSVATNYKVKDQDEVSFFNCVAFASSAIFITEHYKKGRKILLKGSIRQDRWEDSDGAKRQMAKIIVETTRFMDSKPAGASDGF